MPQDSTRQGVHMLVVTAKSSVDISCTVYAGLGLHLDSLRNRHPDQLAQGPTFIGNNIVHPSAKIGSDCQIGPDVSVGLECEIGNGVRISNSVLLHRVKVGA